MACATMHWNFVLQCDGKTIIEAHMFVSRIYSVGHNRERAARSCWGMLGMHTMLLCRIDGLSAKKYAYKVLCAVLDPVFESILE
jgi:hypothetical protein